jgi:predicted site-specific integrase-resolvase
MSTQKKVVDDLLPDEEVGELVPDPVAARYGVSDRTIDRWVDAGDIPAPVYIQGGRCWNEEALDQHDAARKTEAA